MFLLTLSVPTLWNTSPVPGGADLPALELWLLEDVFIIFFSQGSLLGCKVSESKSSAIYLKKCSPESFQKNLHFGPKLKKTENSLFGNQTF